MAVAFFGANAPYGARASLLSAGESHTCALTGVGGVKCWGSNGAGGLGDGTTTDRYTPVDVTGLTSGVTAIAAARHFTCALTSAGGVKCWGHNLNGRLGDGTTTDRYTPVDVTGLTSGMTAVTAGNDHACALTSAGGVKCWGENPNGQLGDGTTTDRYTPVNVSGLTSGVTAVAAGGWHTCALTSAGGLKCWGFNGAGGLGDGTATDRHTPVDVSGLTSGVTAVARGRGVHTCALTSAGGVKCWGQNAYGGLGDGTTTRRHTPVDVSGLTSGVTAVEAGTYHTCALNSAGGVKCWGYNGDGGLGDGTTTDRHTPVDVSGLTSGMTAVTAGAFYACARTNAGGVKCWGPNSHGKLGDGTATDRYTPVDVVGSSTWVAPPTCGNGEVEGDEECDDGDSPPEDGDGCSATCTVEPAFACVGEPSICRSIFGRYNLLWLSGDACRADSEPVESCPATTALQESCYADLAQEAPLSPYSTLTAENCLGFDQLSVNLVYDFDARTWVPRRNAAGNLEASVVRDGVQESIHVLDIALPVSGLLSGSIVTGTSGVLCNAGEACNLVTFSGRRDASCGNGFVDENPGNDPGGESEEECDLGDENSPEGTCTPDCKYARCGDGYTWDGGEYGPALAEACDDGDDDNYNGCSTICQLSSRPCPVTDFDSDGDCVPEARFLADRACRNGQRTNCADNCPLIPNEDQSDVDNNAIGDECENGWRIACSAGSYSLDNEPDWDAYFDSITSAVTALDPTPISDVLQAGISLINFYGSQREPNRVFKVESGPIKNYARAQVVYRTTPGPYYSAPKEIARVAVQMSKEAAPSIGMIGVRVWDLDNPAIIYFSGERALSARDFLASEGSDGLVSATVELPRRGRLKIPAGARAQVTLAATFVESLADPDPDPWCGVTTPLGPSVSVQGQEYVERIKEADSTIVPWVCRDVRLKLARNDRVVWEKFSKFRTRTKSELRPFRNKYVCAGFDDANMFDNNTSDQCAPGADSCKSVCQGGLCLRSDRSCERDEECDLGPCGKLHSIYPIEAWHRNEAQSEAPVEYYCDAGKLTGSGIKTTVKQGTPNADGSDSCHCTDYRGFDASKHSGTFARGSARSLDGVHAGVYPEPGSTSMGYNTDYVTVRRPSGSCAVGNLDCIDGALGW